MGGACPPPGGQPAHRKALEARGLLNAQHMMALLEMADALRLSHLVTVRNASWDETPDSTGDDRVPDPAQRGDIRPLNRRYPEQRADAA